MICETWAPESEKVTTVRGCLIISSAWSMVLVDEGLHEEAPEVALERQVDHRLDGIHAALPGDVGDRAVRARSGRP